MTEGIDREQIQSIDTYYGLYDQKLVSRDNIEHCLAFRLGDGATSLKGNTFEENTDVAIAFARSDKTEFVLRFANTDSIDALISSLEEAKERFDKKD